MNNYLLRGETYVPPLRGDFNRNGRIDNDREERANIEFNAKDILRLQNEMKNLKKRMNVSTIASNTQLKDNSTFASSAKIAEELSDGVQRVYFNNLGKSVVFKNANKPMSECIQIGTNNNVIKNVDEIKFVNDSALKGVVSSGVGLEEEDLEHMVPSMKLIDGIGKSHTHITTQISREYFEEEEYQEEEAYEEEETYEEEEEGVMINKTRIVNKTRMVDKTRIVNKFTPLNEILETKSNVGHRHETSEISRRYEEEEEVEEEVNGEIKTITKIVTQYKPLEEILDDKSDVGHNHDLRYSALNHDHDERYSALNHDHDERYSALNHNHDERYSDINHNHDTRYVALDNVVSEINNVVAQTDANKIPNINAIRSYCSDFLTEASISNNAELQELLRGESAFEAWKSLQPQKQAGEPDYTYNDFITAITGTNGAKGDKGDNGLSAFEVWVSQQTPKESGEYTYQEYLAAITGPQGPQGIQGIQGPKGEDGEDGKDGDGKSWWDYLLQYGLTGASAAQSIAGDYATYTAFTGLQAQVAVIEGQVAALVGGETGEAFADAVADAADASLSLGDYASNIFQNIANVFRNLAGNLQRARQGATTALSSIRATMGGYVPLS